MPNRLDVPPCFSASLRLATDRPIPIARCCDIFPVAQRCMAGQFCLWSHRGALPTDLLTRSSPTRTLLVLNQKIDDCDNVSWVPYETSRTMPTALRCRRPLRSSACPQGASLVHLPVRKALLSFIRLSARRFSRASACLQGATLVHPPLRKALLSDRASLPSPHSFVSRPAPLPSPLSSRRHPTTVFKP